jgi:hypothetical protein
MAFKSKKPPIKGSQEQSKVQTPANGLGFCTSCKAKRYSSGGACLFCGGKVQYL